MCLNWTITFPFLSLILRKRLSVSLHLCLMFASNLYLSLHHKVSSIILAISIFLPSWPHDFVLFIIFCIYDFVSQSYQRWIYHPTNVIHFSFSPSWLDRHIECECLYKSVQWLCIAQSLSPKIIVIFLTVLIFSVS